MEVKDGSSRPQGAAAAASAAPAAGTAAAGTAGQPSAAAAAAGAGAGTGTAAAPAGAAAGAAASQKSKPAAGGDLTVALRQEREENRRLREQIEQLQKRTAGAGPGAESAAPGDLELTEDELLEGNVQAVNAKLKRLVGTAVRDAVTATRQDREAADAVDGLLGRYAIFNDDDKELAKAACLAATAALQGLPTEAGLADAERTVGEIAKTFSRLKVQKTGGAADAIDGVEPPLPVGAGTGEAAHLRAGDKPPRTWAEASRIANRILAKFRARKASA